MEWGQAHCKFVSKLGFSQICDFDGMIVTIKPGRIVHCRGRVDMICGMRAEPVAGFELGLPQSTAT
jgi:hypothetical protein